MIASRKMPHLILWLNITFWVLVSIIITLIVSSRYSLDVAFYRTVGNVICLAILFYGNAFLLMRVLLKRKRYVAYSMATLLLLLGVFFVRRFFNTYFPLTNFEPLIKGQVRADLFNLITTLGFFSFSLLYQIMYSQAKEERKVLAAKNEYNEAKIQFLKAQINPHFLFNSLNNIYSLAVLKSDDTPDMILKLSDLLRYVIYNSEQKKVALESEVAHIYQFIDLFQMRFDEDQDVRFTVEGHLADIRIEPMILIPLVENCFKHCDFDSNEAAFIEINLQVEDKHFVFKTLNSKNDLNTQKDKTGGVGLSNIQKRLQLKYPNRHKIELKNQKDSFEVYLEMSISDDVK